MCWQAYEYIWLEVGGWVRATFAKKRDPSRSQIGAIHAFRIHADHAPLRRHVGADLAQEILARDGGVGRGLAGKPTF